MSDNYLLIKLSGVRIPRVSLKKRDRIFPISFFYEIGARSSELYSSMVDRYMDSTFLDVFLLVSIVLFVFICISSVVVFGNITWDCDESINE